ncbi:WXG100 family type VII secretion target [Micromonospora olivasterospora]|uniref:WXG100 family type VII secretion target n=1 Tax=Micromonospora olivasterospora TaxID=1880 RepID=UPI0011A2A320|nr:hypothetical protein [Micromonospora olivasterospora]
MGGEFGLMADEATITGMVKAFAQAQTEASDSHRNVVAATEALIKSWTSDTASPRFLEAVKMWLAGWRKVQQGLDKLNQSMQQYSHLTTTTEDDNAMQAGNWAREQPVPGLSRIPYIPDGSENSASLPPRTRWMTEDITDGSENSASLPPRTRWMTEDIPDGSENSASLPPRTRWMTEVRDS